MTGAASWTLAEYLFLLVIFGMTKSCHPTLLSTEALALANELTSSTGIIKNSRVDVYVDSSALLYARNNQAARFHAFSDAMKAIFEALMATICSRSPLPCSVCANSF